MNGFTRSPRNSRSRRIAALLLLGFSSGLPLALSRDLLAAWLTDAGFDPARIGLLGLAGLPYAYKVFWSPWMDRYSIPLFGRRRGWMLVSQLLLIAAITLLSATNPNHSLTAVALAAATVAFFSATQDIVIDAWRADILEPDERGPGAALSVCGYRLGMIASGAGALVLVGRYHLSWPVACRCVAAGMAVGMLGALIAPEPIAAAAPRTLAQAVGRPLTALLSRGGGWLILLFVFLFKLPEHMANAMSLPFLIQLGIAKDQIGAVRQGLGVAVTIVGAIIGGGIVNRLGIWRSLWVFGVLHSASNLAFFLLSRAGPSYAGMVAAIGVENLCIGLTTAGFTAWMIGQCDAGYSAFQFALLSGVMALGYVAANPLAGWLATALGWQTFFGISALFGIPGLLLLATLGPRTQFPLESMSPDRISSPAAATL